MANFRSFKTLQKFASSQAAARNLFNIQRHLVSRKTYKQTQPAALAEWRQLAA